MSQILNAFKIGASAVIQNEYVQNCSKRAVTAVAVAALFGAFSLHAAAIGCLPVSTILASAVILSLKIASLASLQYLVEKAVATVLDKVFVSDTAIHKIVKFSLPLLLSISASFGLLYAFDGLYGVENVQDYAYDYLEIDNLSEAMFYIPSPYDGLIFIETWGLKVMTEISVAFAETSFSILSSTAGAAKNVCSAAYNKLFKAA